MDRHIYIMKVDEALCGHRDVQVHPSWDNVRDSQRDGLCGLRLGDGGGCEVRPQGGGGVDHPTKVQQRKAQTDTPIFCTPRGISYPRYVSVGSIFPSLMYSDISLSSIVRPYWSSTWSVLVGSGDCNLDSFVLGYDFWELLGYGFEWISYDIVSDDDLKFYDI